MADFKTKDVGTDFGFPIRTEATMDSEHVRFTVFLGREDPGALGESTCTFYFFYIILK